MTSPCGTRGIAGSYKDTPISLNCFHTPLFFFFTQERDFKEREKDAFVAGSREIRCTLVPDGQSPDSTSPSQSWTYTSHRQQKFVFDFIQAIVRQQSRTQSLRDP